MKKINFIKTIAPQEYNIIRSWLLSTGIMVIVSLLVMAYVSLQQRRTLAIVMRERNNLSHYAQQYAIAEQQKKKTLDTKAMYEKHVHTINSYLCDPKNPDVLLHVLTDICKKHHISIQSLMIDRNRVSLRGACENIDMLAGIVHDLEVSSQLRNVTISSIEKHKRESTATETACLCTITAQRVKN